MFRQPRSEQALFAPNSNTKMSPETTGDTENGRSISVVSRLLPGKANLAMAQLGGHPEDQVFSGTLIAATSSVSLIAEMAYRGWQWHRGIRPEAIAFSASTKTTDERQREEQAPGIASASVIRTRRACPPAFGGSRRHCAAPRAHAFAPVTGPARLITPACRARAPAPRLITSNTAKEASHHHHRDRSGASA